MSAPGLSRLAGYVATVCVKISKGCCKKVALNSYLFFGLCRVFAAAVAVTWMNQLIAADLPAVGQALAVQTPAELLSFTHAPIVFHR